jgi:hypothetical protein
MSSGLKDEQTVIRPPERCQITKKVLTQKFLLDAKILSLRYVQFSQNRHFKFLPVDFQYHRTSSKKLKSLSHGVFSSLLDAEIRLRTSYLKKAT